jgi:hypothetical protein
VALQVLLGRDNPFARAVAQGNVSDHSPMLEAVAYDLDTLQVGQLRPGLPAQYWGLNRAYTLQHVQDHSAHVVLVT